MLKVVSYVVETILLSLVFAGLPCAAQNAAPANPPRVPSLPSPSASPQERALWRLGQLFDISRTSPDQIFRIQVEAEIADTLWQHDRDRSRTYFLDAFRAVASIRNEEPDPLQAARAQAQTDSVKAALRKQLVSAISRHDPALAEVLAKQLARSADAGTIDLPDLYGGMAAGAVGVDMQRAVAMARAGLAAGITPTFVDSLLWIRNYQPQLADGLFYESLPVAARDVEGFGNDLRLLASYVFTPGTSPADIPDNQSDSGDPDTASPVPATLSGNTPQLIPDFLNFAFQASLSHSAVYGSQQVPGWTSYLPLMQLLPYYEVYSPDTAAAIADNFNRLVAGVPDPQKRSLLLNLVARAPLGQVAQAGNTLARPEQKDLMYQQGALQACRQGDLEQALTMADAISSETVRQRVKSTIYQAAAAKALDKANIEMACQYAAEIPDLSQQSRMFAQIIRTLAANDQLARANDALDNAERQITKAGDSRDKAKALLLLSSVALAVDPVRAEAILQMAVMAINHSDVSGGNRKTRTAARGVADAGELWLAQSFGPLARVDFDGALSLAQAIEVPEVSIRAEIAACRGALSGRTGEKKNTRPLPAGNENPRKIRQ